MKITSPAEGAAAPFWSFPVCSSLIPTHLHFHTPHNNLVLAFLVRVNTCELWDQLACMEIQPTAVDWSSPCLTLSLALVKVNIILRPESQHAVRLTKDTVSVSQPSISSGGSMTLQHLPTPARFFRDVMVPELRSGLFSEGCVLQESSCLQIPLDPFLFVHHTHG